MFNLIVKGFFIGLANIIPGFSGGTMAVILGVYQQLIQSLRDLFGLNKSLCLRSLTFLFPIFIGAGISVFSLASLMDFLLNSYKEITFFFFIGVIVASIPLIKNLHDDMSFTFFRGFFFLLLFFVPICFLLITISDSEQVLNLNNIRTIFHLGFSGFVAAIAMLVPGISGSFILLCIGTYSTVIFAIKSFNLVVLAVIGVGVVLGVFCGSFFISFCIKRYASLTYYAILGLVVGAIPGLWPGISTSFILFDLISFAFGFAIITCFDRFSRSSKKADIR